MYLRKQFGEAGTRAARYIGLLFIGGCGLTIGSDDGSGRPTLDLSTLGLGNDSTHYEAAANGLFDVAEPVGLTDEPRVIRGEIDGNVDVDVYDFGPVVPGDHIFVTMTTADTLDGAITLFDGAGAALLVNDHRNVYLGQAAPFIDLVIRRPSNACYVAVSATPGFDAAGEYGLVASKEYPSDIPLGSPDSVLLVFDGEDDVRIGGRIPVDVPEFDAGSISAAYEGQSQEMMSRIVEAVRADYEGLNVTIHATNEGAVYDGTMTRVYFGTFDSALLGVAEGVDEFNGTSAQRAIIFTDTFDAFMPLQPSTSQMAQAIANVASHEIGHLLGLVHTADPNGIMDVTASLGQLLGDQTFEKSPLHAAVFPLGEQDGLQSLMDSVGGDADLLLSRPRPPEETVLRARTDVAEPPARSQWYLSGCGLDP